jgi:hypothetical protein
VNFQECGGGNGLWDETVLLQVACKERGVFCFGIAAMLVWKMMVIIAYHINENLTKAGLSVSSLVCCLFCRVNLFGLKYKNLKNRSVCGVVGYNVRKAVRLVLYVGMVFVCCQLTWE